MNLKKPSALVAIALVASLSVAGMAAAAESDDGEEGVIVTPQIIVDEQNGLILIGLPVDGELPECGDESPEEPGEVRGDSTDDDAGDAYGPGDCIEIVMNHPSGKTHHGAVVSSVAKSLHPSTLDGIKKGEIMRYVAKAGKVDDGEGSDDGEASGAKDNVKKDKVKKDKPAKVKKDKAAKSNNGKAKGKSNR